MNNRYVEAGYVENGYVEGDSFLSSESGSVPLKFFVSSGSLATEDFVTAVQGRLSENDLALCYDPDEKKHIFASKFTMIEFVNGALNIGGIKAALLGDDDFMAQIRTANPTVSIISAEGDVVADATVEQINGNSFTITVPQAMVGTQYKIEIGLRGCSNG